MFTAGCRLPSQLGNTRQQTPGLLGFRVVSCRNVTWGGLCWVNQPGALLNPRVKAHESWREPRGRAHSSCKHCTRSKALLSGGETISLHRSALAFHAESFGGSPLRHPGVPFPSPNLTQLCHRCCPGVARAVGRPQGTQSPAASLRGDARGGSHTVLQAAKETGKGLSSCAGPFFDCALGLFSPFACNLPARV